MRWYAVEEIWKDIKNYNGCYQVSNNRFDMNMKYIDSFDSASDAGNELNIDISSISKCARGERNSAGGYI